MTDPIDRAAPGEETETLLEARTYQRDLYRGQIAELTERIEEAERRIAGAKAHLRIVLGSAAPMSAVYRILDGGEIEVEQVGGDRYRLVTRYKVPPSDD